MYKPILRRIFLKDSDGGITPFDPENLLTRLAGAFQSAGQADECYVADDIVLALEYTLRRAPRPELVFSEGEIDAAVIRILESSGFPEAAQAFRSGSREQLLQLSTTGAALQEFLSAHLGCSQERLVKISEKCSAALQQLNIEAASLHLILELARHYERETAETDLRNPPPQSERANTEIPSSPGRISPDCCRRMPQNCLKTAYCRFPVSLRYFPASAFSSPWKSLPASTTSIFL